MNSPLCVCVRVRVSVRVRLAARRKRWEATPTVATWCSQGGRTQSDKVGQCVFGAEHRSRVCLLTRPRAHAHTHRKRQTPLGAASPFILLLCAVVKNVIVAAFC